MKTRSSRSRRGFSKRSIGSIARRFELCLAGVIGSRIAGCCWLGRVEHARLTKFHDFGWELLSVALFQNGFELGDDLEVFGASGRALYVNQPLQRQAMATEAEYLENQGVRLKVFV